MVLQCALKRNAIYTLNRHARSPQLSRNTTCIFIILISTQTLQDVWKVRIGIMHALQRSMSFLRRCSWNSQTLIKFWWTSIIPNFIELEKIVENSRSVARTSLYKTLLSRYRILSFESHTGSRALCGDLLHWKLTHILYAFFWMIPRRLNFIRRRFRTLCLFHLHRQVGACLVHSTRTYLHMKMEQTECSETSAYKIQTPGNHPKESIQHSGHGESLKSRLPISVKNFDRSGRGLFVP